MSDDGTQFIERVDQVFDILEEISPVTISQLAIESKISHRAMQNLLNLIVKIQGKRKIELLEISSNIRTRALKMVRLDNHQFKEQVIEVTT
jgi:hypothetical protein